ncbi:hypothetical protein RJ639_043933 [Escallonia herrerae]|uniref:RBR-type E3 ubiquitin transferase n=1 Tax=Escallonia herrerae TaxID=1293975 RepID=A0AA88WCE9_9ASTE|nr:hypothetical protein RJ639_043933 [Escallonia herrerae]
MASKYEDIPPLDDDEQQQQKIRLDQKKKEKGDHEGTKIKWKKGNPRLFDDIESKFWEISNTEWFDDNDVELQHALYSSVLVANDSVHFMSDDENEASKTQEGRKRNGKEIYSSVKHVRANSFGGIWRASYEEGQCSYDICEICNDKTPKGVAVISHKCGHMFCKDCVAAYIAKKAHENIASVNCPGSKCSLEFRPGDCSSVMPCEVLDRWERALCEARVLASPKMLRCPFKDCLATFVDDERGFLIRACPICWKIFCMKCRVSWHFGESCAQYRRQFLEDLLGEAEALDAYWMWQPPWKPYEPSLQDIYNKLDWASGKSLATVLDRYSSEAHN